MPPLTSRRFTIFLFRSLYLSFNVAASVSMFEKGSPLTNNVPIHALQLTDKVPLRTWECVTKRLRSNPAESDAGGAHLVSLIRS